MHKELHILILEDVAADAELVERELRKAKIEFSAKRVETREAFLTELKDFIPDLILADYSLPSFDGISALSIAQEACPDVPFVFVSGAIGEELAIETLKKGATDYVLKQRLSRLVPSVRQALREAEERTARKQAEEALRKRTAELSETNSSLQEALSEIEELKNRLEAENTYLQEEIKLQHNFEEIICCSKIVKKVLRKIEQVASTDATVLILGETGTGKELLVRAVHNISPRRERPLVKVNCAALPANLIESELFGHEKGAFTGAVTRKIGRFELADGGTIFLDEIGDLSLELQTKLLRVLQEGEFERLGNPNTTKVDVRVIAATNRDLEKAIEKGAFREDLYYRLNVFPIKSPPLRERKEEIPLLVNHFIKKYGARIGKEIELVSKNMMDTLQAYDWPGNVRELENTVERALIISQGKQLELGDWLPRDSISRKDEISTKSDASHISTLEESEREYIIAVLEMTDWQVRGEKGAAKILDINPSTLESRMRKLGIKRKQ